MTVYQDYLSLSNEEFNKLWTLHPYIIKVPKHSLLRSLRILLNHNFSQQQLLEILTHNSELVTIKYATIKHSIKVLRT